MSLLLDKNDSILITGALGFVGAHLCNALVRDGVRPEQIICTAVDKAEPPVPGAAVVVLDIRNAQPVREVIERFKPKFLAHLAAVASPVEARANAREAWRVNVDGTLNIADAVLAVSPHTRMIFAGSSESYGPEAALRGEPISEDAPLRPASVYGATKAAAEIALLQMAREGLDVVCFRAFNHAGPGQSPDYVLAAFARQVARIEAGLQEHKLSVGNIEASRDFLDVRDVVSAYVGAIARPQFQFQERVLNIASGKPRKIKDMLEVLTNESTSGIDVSVDPAKLRKNEIPIVCGDASRIEKVLNWRPQRKLEDTIKETLNYWRGQVRT